MDHSFTLINLACALLPKEKVYKQDPFIYFIFHHDLNIRFK